MTPRRGRRGEGPLVVVGDVLLDVDLVAQADRLSPEAPVPVLHSAEERRRPGGAGLAALLAADHGRPVVLIAPLASDEAAAHVRQLLGERVELIGLPYTGSTPVKTRLRVGDHAIARLDSGDARGAIGALPARAEEALAEAAAILVADYGRGATAHPALRRALQRTAAGTPLVWDPHPLGARPVPGTLLATPNRAELASFAAGERDSSLAEIARQARDVAMAWGVTGIGVTLGERGAMLCVGDGAPFLVGAAPVRATGDTCGAGDSFAAALAAALADGAVLSEAVTEAVARAGAFVAAGGAAALAAGAFGAAGGAARLAAGGAAMDGDIDGDPVALAVAARASGRVVVATGGCFDLIHAGHIATLEAARALGDCLIVCLNSDDSVRRLKGAQRPLQSAEDRARVLAALACVDGVLVFDEDTPAEVLRRLRPDIWAKGGDYTGVAMPESAVLGEWGGVAVTVPYLHGRSTTALVRSAGERPDLAPDMQTRMGASQR